MKKKYEYLKTLKKSGLHIPTTGKYILVHGKVKEEKDLLKWADWFDNANRLIARDELSNGLVVSTVFLGIDSSPSSTKSGGLPMLFETMVFGGDKELTEHYSTWTAAKEGHRRWVKRLEPIDVDAYLELADRLK